MSQENSQNSLNEVTELAKLKVEAESLGVSFHPNIGLETLQARIDEAKEALALADAPVPQEETSAQKRSRKAKAARALVRVLINCNDPAKREWPGEVITVSNSVIGSIKRYIPYNSDAPTHIERALLNTLLEKRVQSFSQKPGKNGIPQPKARTIPAYSITIMPALTEAEVEALAKSQAMRGVLNNDD